MSTRRYRTIDSPIGPITLDGEDEVLTGLWMQDHTDPPAGREGWVPDTRLLPEVVDQLRRYFVGELTDFDVPVRMEGTPFQRRVWSALTDIPYGETRSYGQLAAAIGQPTASRAVGLANGRNPVSIIVPCHRVIGASGALIGYGGGLERKRTLLELERSHRQPRLDVGV